MTEQFRIRIANDFLTFSAAHFITLSDEVCESIHGHDYRVIAEIGGPLGSQQMVVDFIAAQEALFEVVRAFDHSVLLPTQSPAIRTTADDREVTVRFGQRRWVFPRADCRLLDIPNTTSEMLAAAIGRKLLEALDARAGFQPATLRIELVETTGQTAIWQYEAE